MPLLFPSKMSSLLLVFDTELVTNFFVLSTEFSFYLAKCNFTLVISKPEAFWFGLTVIIWMLRKGRTFLTLHNSTMLLCSEQRRNIFSFTEMTIQKEDTEHTVQKKTSLKNPANHNAKAAFVILPLALSKRAIREGERRNREREKSEREKKVKKKNFFKKSERIKWKRRKNKGKGKEKRREKGQGKGERERERKKGKGVKRK